MIIKKIELFNIRSHKNSIIEFPETSILLAGDIGSGKSSILLGLEFGLFGFQKGELEGKSLLRHGCSKGYVKIDLEINQKRISIFREIIKKKNSYLQNDAWIEINDKKEKLSVEEINNKITELLNFPDPKKKNLIYRFTVYTPQEQMKRILLEKSELRLDLIRKLFDMDKYKRIKDNLALYLRELRNDLKTIKLELEEFKDLEIELENVNKELEAIEKERVKMEKIIKEKETGKDEIENLIDKLKQEIEKLNEEITRLNKAKAYLKEKNESLNWINLEIEKIEKELKEKNIGFDFNKIKTQKIELINKTHEIEKELEKVDGLIKKNLEEKEKLGKINFYHKNRIKQLKRDLEESLKLDICPKCKQKVALNHKEKIRKEIEGFIDESNLIIERNEKELEKIKKEIEELEKKFEEKNRIGKEIEKAIKEKEFLMDKVMDWKRKTERKIKLKKEIEELEKLIEKLEGNEKLYKEKSEELKRIEEKYRIFINEFLKIKEKLIGFNEKIANLNEKKAQLKTKKEKKKKLEERKRKIERFQSWLTDEFVKIIEKIEKIIFLKINKEFESLLKRWFELLVEDDISIRLADDFTPIIEQNGYENEYSNLSGGEKTALALAYRLALNQLISLLTKVKTKGLIILDEPTDGFSQKQIEKMIDVFNELKANQLIIVSHDPKIESLVEKIIRLKKEENKTRVES